jgi:hypothetical protein
MKDDAGLDADSAFFRLDRALFAKNALSVLYQCCIKLLIVLMFCKMLYQSCLALYFSF